MNFKQAIFNMTSSVGVAIRYWDVQHYLMHAVAARGKSANITTGQSII